MPNYKVRFEYCNEVEAEDEMDALIQTTEFIAEWIGSEAIVEEIEDNDAKGEK